MKSLTRLKRRRNMLYAFMALGLGSPMAQADIYDDAWSCAVAVKEGYVDAAIIGGKALKFIATKPDCVTRLGTPATAAPIGVVVGLANIGVLPKSQPSCGNKLYETAAKPVAMALDATLGELGLLKGEAKKMLVKIASDDAAGALLAKIPGMDFVSGSLTCGCDLVDAGLNTETIEKVLNTADNIGNKCLGPVWDKAKEIAGEVVNFAGDAAEEGIRQVSNLGDALAGQTKHMPYLAYYDQNWAPKVEFYATHEFNNPNAWHDNKVWDQVWGPCVIYFDEHTQSGDTAQFTCDNMRSGGRLFPKKYFGHELFQRVFEFEASVLVNAEREKAYAEFADLKTGTKLPASIMDDTECYASASIKLHPKLPSMRKAAINEVFGIPKKEKTHNGLAVLPNSPPAQWASDTFGAYALTYFGEVDAGQFRADAAKAVQLALADFNAEERVRAKLADKILKHYQTNSCIRIDQTDKDKQRVNNLIGMCPTKTCKDKIANDYKACRADVDDWYKQNAGLMGNFDSSSGQQATKEWQSRLEQCVTEAKQTAKENQVTLNDTPVRNSVIEVPNTSNGMNGKLDANGPATDSRPRTVKEEPRSSSASLRELEPVQRLDDRVPVTDSKRRTVKDEPRTSREPLREREPIQRIDDRTPATDSASRRTVIDEPRTSREPLRERESIQRIDDRTPATDSTRRRTVTDEPRISREPLREREPIQRIDDRTPVTDSARRRTVTDEPRTSREPLREREPIQRIDDRTPATDSATRRTFTDEPRISREPLRERAPAQRVDARVPAIDTTPESRSRIGTVDARSARDYGNTVPTIDSTPSTLVTTPVIPKDLAGCTTARAVMSPQVYVCSTDVFYRNCLDMVKRDANIKCQIIKD